MFEGKRQGIFLEENRFFYGIYLFLCIKIREDDKFCSSFGFYRNLCVCNFGYPIGFG